MCNNTETSRMEMNKKQPPSQFNYTTSGFHKMSVPEDLWRPIVTFWNVNKDKVIPEEDWLEANTYVNHWNSPTYLISLEDRKMWGSGKNLRKYIRDQTRNILEDWIGHVLLDASIYGIRVYKNGAILSTHVDRLPLVISALINVAQEVNEPWPLEVYGHNGK